MARECRHLERGGQNRRDHVEHGLDHEDRERGQSIQENCLRQRPTAGRSTNQQRGRAKGKVTTLRLTRPPEFRPATGKSSADTGNEPGRRRFGSGAPYCLIGGSRQTSVRVEGGNSKLNHRRVRPYASRGSVWSLEEWSNSRGQNFRPAVASRLPVRPTLLGAECFVWIWITVSVSAKTPLRRKYVVFERYFVEVSDVRNISTVSRTTLGRLMTTFGVACV